MARVTVEDCVLQVPNRFDLVLLAGQRARDVSAGQQLTVDRDNDKNPVVALREIAESTVDLDDLQSAIILGLQRHVEVDEPELDEIDEAMILAAELNAEDMGSASTAAKDEAGEEDADESEDEEA